MFIFLPTFLAIGCADPGWMRGPLGGTRIRTASWRVGRRDNRDELLLFLSNGVFDDCFLPAFDDQLVQAQLVQPTRVAACREGAQHMLFSFYGEAADASWTGTFPYDSTAEPRDVGISVPQFVRGRYYGVEEAYVVQVEGLRVYASGEAIVSNPMVGEGGFELEEEAARLFGSFSLEGEDSFSGDFQAERCEGDTSFLDGLDEAWLNSICPL